MAARVYDEKNNPVDMHQMAPLLPPTYNHTVGLDCLRTVDTLTISQTPSLSEGKLFAKENR
jgi:hypothetical protein